MASRAVQNVISVLALIEGTQSTVRQQTKAKTPLKLCDRLYSACREAQELWDVELTKAEILSIAGRMREIERRSFVGVWADNTAYTSFGLGLLDELYQVIKDQWKLAALDKIHAALWRLHRYYDKKLNRFEMYAQASQACGYWREIAE